MISEQKKNDDIASIANTIQEIETRNGPSKPLDAKTVIPAILGLIGHNGTSFCFIFDKALQKHQSTTQAVPKLRQLSELANKGNRIESEYYFISAELFSPFLREAVTAYYQAKEGNINGLENFHYAAGMMRHEIVDFLKKDGGLTAAQSESESRAVVNDMLTELDAVFPGISQLLSPKQVLETASSPSEHWTEKLAGSFKELEASISHKTGQGEKITEKDFDIFVNQSIPHINTALHQTFKKHKNLLEVEKKYNIGYDLQDDGTYVSPPWTTGKMRLLIVSLAHAYIEQKTGEAMPLGTEAGRKGLQHFQKVKQQWISQIGNFLNEVDPESAIQNRMAANTFANDFMDELAKAIPDLKQHLNEQSRSAA